MSKLNEKITELANTLTYLESLTNRVPVAEESIKAELKKATEELANEEAEANDVVESVVKVVKGKKANYVVTYTNGKKEVLKNRVATFKRAFVNTQSADEYVSSLRKDEYTGENRQADWGYYIAITEA